MFRKRISFNIFPRCRKRNLLYVLQAKDMFVTELILTHFIPSYDFIFLIS